jgi:hypothetical protein
MAILIEMKVLSRLAIEKWIVPFLLAESSAFLNPPSPFTQSFKQYFAITPTAFKNFFRKRFLQLELNVPLFLF